MVYISKSTMQDLCQPALQLVLEYVDHN